MPQIIKIGGGIFSKGKLLRINSNNNDIEVSTNECRSWSPRCANASYGTLRDLLLVGREILAVTSRGIYVSTNSVLLANTTKGLYYSTNGGRGWVRR